MMGRRCDGESALSDRNTQRKQRKLISNPLYLSSAGSRNSPLRWAHKDSPLDSRIICFDRFPIIALLSSLPSLIPLSCHPHYRRPSIPLQHYPYYILSLHLVQLGRTRREGRECARGVAESSSSTGPCPDRCWHRCRWQRVVRRNQGESGGGGT
jgi:hypothetical protein